MLDFRLKGMEGIMTYIEGGGDVEKVPRHKEVNENLARMILRKWKLL